MAADPDRRRRAAVAPWLLWFLVAFSLNAVLDMVFDVTWWIRWVIVLAAVPLAIVAWAGWQRRR